MKNHWRTLLSLLPASIERSLYERYFKAEDLAWKQAGRPLPVSYLSKHDALRKAARDYGLDTLVETGTYLGDTLYMLYPDFENLYSIELSPLFHARAGKRFRHMRNIHLVLGDSGQELAVLVPKLQKPALFWLDGHYSGGVTAKGDKDCPIIEELNAIFQSPYDHVIYIDDARLFTGKDDYPTMEELLSMMRKKRPGYGLTVENDCIRLTPPRHV